MGTIDQWWATVEELRDPVEPIFLRGRPARAPAAKSRDATSADAAVEDDPPSIDEASYAARLPPADAPAVPSIAAEAALILDADPETQRVLLTAASDAVREFLPALLAYRSLDEPTALEQRVDAFVAALQSADEDTKRALLTAADEELRAALAEQLRWKSASHEEMMGTYIALLDVAE
jgi:hypothetical protein